MTYFIMVQVLCVDRNATCTVFKHRHKFSQSSSTRCFSTKQIGRTYNIWRVSPPHSVVFGASRPMLLVQQSMANNNRPSGSVRF